MKVLIFSDSHGKTVPMCRAIEEEAPDHVLHLGDYARDADFLRETYPHLPVTNVPGNCDYGNTAPESCTLTLDGIRVFMTHGHRYQVKYMYLRAIYAALEQDAQILLFGHTHRAECFEEKGLWALNPGAAGQGSYGLLEIENSKFTLRLRGQN